MGGSSLLQKKPTLAKKRFSSLQYAEKTDVSAQKNLLVTANTDNFQTQQTIEMDLVNR